MSLIKRLPVLIALAAQAVALAITVLAATPAAPAPVWWAVHGLLAAIIGAAAGLPRWWWPIQLLAPTAVALLLAAGLPTWGYGLILLALVLLYGGGVVTRVPLYLSDRAACEALAGLLTDREAPSAVDLGAGFGGPMRHLSRRFPAGRFVSVEASPVTWFVAWLLALASPRVRVRWGDLWRHDLSSCDLVYVFLSPAPMPHLWEHFQTHARPGTLLVSNSFPVPDQEPLRVIDLPGRADARLYVYRR